ncbi:hypothetical protein M514_16029 [Trichuris suis]|uniref:SCAN domain-containing protein n=1 Tax=Trichuris suis TaxID=68888 RepID=A0A085NR23_9BILA|nr:hypothetical protein M514_16029 [Trichuris suis]
MHHDGRNQSHGEEMVTEEVSICARCYVYINETSGAHTCRNCGQNVHAICEHASKDGREAKRMKVDSDEQFPPARLEVTARVPVPDVDSGRREQSLLTKQFLLAPGCLRTFEPTIHHTSGFTLCRKKLVRVVDVPDQEVPLQLAATTQYTGSGQGLVSSINAAVGKTGKLSVKFFLTPWLNDPKLKEEHASA